MLYRLFIAAELPPDVKAALVAAQERLRRDHPPVKWVAPEAMHLTLRFLGETDAELAPRLGAGLRAALEGWRAIPVHLTSAGAFPNDRRPSVLWAGIGGALAALGELYVAVAAAVAALGFPPEARPFQAHLTLGRVRREASAAQQQQIGAAIRALPAFAPMAWTVDRVALFRSQLDRGGPIYTKIADCRLQIAD
jgi:2'-5' RNA ligase